MQASRSHAGLPEGAVLEDIRLAIGLIGFVSVAMFAGTLRALRRCSHLCLDLVGVLIVALTIAYSLTVWGQLWIVKWIPLPSVIVLSNWFPPLMGALAAVVWLRFEPVSDEDGSSENHRNLHIMAVLRRLPILLVSLVVAIYSVMYFIPSEPPECRDEWVEPDPPLFWPVCLQTTNRTCSAAAAATILNTLGIQTSEQEMAELCLTKSGTTWLGLYHGLSTKLLGTVHAVSFFEGDVSDLTQVAHENPVLLCCELNPAIAKVAPRYLRNGWRPGLAHSVVYFGMKDGRHLIGDPSVGYEIWTSQDLEMLWTGEGLRISSNGRYDQSASL